MNTKNFASALQILNQKKTFKIFGFSLAFFVALYLFFYGVFNIPFPGLEGGIGFFRMETLSIFDRFYVALASLLSALIVAFNWHSAEKKSKAYGGVSAVGMATGFLGAVCPACLGINLLVFGNVLSVPLAFLTPYIPFIQSGGLVLLAVGVVFFAKNAATGECSTCSVGKPDKYSDMRNPAIFTPPLLLLAIIVLIYQVMSVPMFSSLADYTSGVLVATPNGKTINIAEITEKVTPEAGFTIGATWNGIVTKMIEEGVLDPDKLEDILTKKYRQEIKPEWRAILKGENSQLEINKDNGVFMMYVLWTFAKHNKNQILFDSPFAKYFKNYDIGVGRAGYGDITLLQLSPEQQKIVDAVAANAFRPCCGNSTARPDCSHGYSALGLVQLMASQGFSEAEIFDAFIKFNSFWFPQNYVHSAIYLEAVEGIDWKDADKKRLAGPEFSSLSGSVKIKNFLKRNLGL